MSYGALVFLALFFARTTWRQLMAVTGSLDDLLGPEATNVAERFLRLLRPAYQWFALAIGGAGSLIAALLMKTAVSGDAHLDVGYLVTVTWTGAIGLLIVYWIWAAPMLLFQASRVEYPVVDALAPLLTPGIRKARRLMQTSAWRAVARLTLFAIPIGLTVAVDPSDTVVLVIAGLALAFSTMTVAFVAVVPQRFLGAICRQGRDQELDRIRVFMPPSAHVMKEPTAEMAVSIHFYEQVAGASVTTLSWRRVAEWLLQFAAATTPLAVPIAIALTT